MSGKEQPIGTALLICDQVISEETTNKKTLVGTFNNLTLPALPCTYAGLSVYASLTNGKGKVKVMLRCTSVENDQTLFVAPMDAEFPNPGHVSEFVFNLRNVQFTVPGIHCFELLVDDALILETRFTVNVDPKIGL